MRAVHAYMKIDTHAGCAYFREFDILVWKLAVARNKSLGFHTVLYTVEADREALADAGITALYDEVNYVTDDRLQRINLTYFWAAFKFIAIERELDRGEDFFVVDTDLVFMDDSIKNALANSPALFWQNEEPLIRYPKFETINVPPGFKYPSYFSAMVRPVNTAIIKVDNHDALREWLRVAWSFMIDNQCDEGVNPNPNHTGYIVTVEQRFLPIVLTRKYHIPLSFFATRVNPNFSKSHFHIWGYKYAITVSTTVRNRWTKTLLETIKVHEPELYKSVIDDPARCVSDALAAWNETFFEPMAYKYTTQEENAAKDIH